MPHSSFISLYSVNSMVLNNKNYFHIFILFSLLYCTVPCTHTVKKLVYIVHLYVSTPLVSHFERCANHTRYQLGVLSTLHECTVLQTFIYTFITQ